MWSTVITPSATAYPDSGKVGVWTGVEGENLMARRSAPRRVLRRRARLAQDGRPHFGIGESPPLAIARSVSLERAVVA